MNPPEDVAELKMFTTEQVAEMFSVQPATVRLWIRNGTLKAIKINRNSLRIPKDALTAFVNERYGG